MTEIDLSGKSALITGGTSGIGQAICLALAKAGANTAAIYLDNEDGAQAALASRLALGVGTPCNYQADISDAAQVTSLADRVQADFGGHLDLLILDAGVGAHGTVAETDPEQWDRVLAVDLTSSFLLVRALLPLMGSGGAIVAIGSGAVGMPGSALYSAAKAGLTAFIQTLAQDIGPNGIRANVVAPGSTDTHFGGQAKTGDFKRRIADRTALRRIGEPDDIAGSVLFLCSDLARFVTGQVLHVDGGYL